MCWPVLKKSATFVYYQICDCDYEEVILYANSSWLVLEKCKDRELQKYEGLKSYILCEGQPNTWFVQLEKAFNNPMTELYLMLFDVFQNAVVTFMNLNNFYRNRNY